MPALTATGLDLGSLELAPCFFVLGISHPRLSHEGPLFSFSHPALTAWRYCYIGTASSSQAQVMEMRHTTWGAAGTLPSGFLRAPVCMGCWCCREQVCEDSLETGMQKGNIRSPLSGAWQLQPVVPVTWAAEGSPCSDRQQPRPALGRELSCCFPFWSLKSRYGEVPRRGLAGSQ